MYHNLIFTNLHELKESNAGFHGICLIFWRTWLQRLDYIIFPFWRAFWRCSSSALKILSVKIIPKFHKNYWPQTKCYFYGNHPKVSVFNIVLLMMVQHLTAVIPTIKFWICKKYIASFLVRDWFICFLATCDNVLKLIVHFCLLANRYDYFLIWAETFLEVAWNPVS